MEKYVKYIIIVAICYFIALSLFVYFTPAFSGNEINGERADQLGSFIGGVIGSFFSFASLIILIINIKENNDNIIKNDQENRFFSLLNIYNDYCKDLYIESLDNNKEIHGKKTFLIISREFEKIYQLIEKRCNVDDGKKIKVTFYFLYYGVGDKSKIQLKQNLLAILDESTIDNVIKEARQIYESQQPLANTEEVSSEYYFKYYKIIGGHQSRLYQYFNLLEHLFSFIDNCKLISDKKNLTMLKY